MKICLNDIIQTQPQIKCIKTLQRTLFLRAMSAQQLLFIYAPPCIDLDHSGNRTTDYSRKSTEVSLCLILSLFCEGVLDPVISRVSKIDKVWTGP